MVSSDKPRSVSFRVFGEPRPGGSKKHIGGGRIKEDCKGAASWRKQVALAAKHAIRGAAILEGPLVLRVAFWRARPKSHFRADGSVKPSAPEYPTTAPDTTKLMRSTEDALKGIIWNDDAQVIVQQGKKFWATEMVKPGAEIYVKELEQHDVFA